MAARETAPVETAPFPAARQSERDERLGRRLMAELFGTPAERGFAVRYWTGFEEAPPGSAPAFTVVFRRPGLLRRLFLPPSEPALAEAFARGDAEVEGDLEAATALPTLLAARLRSPARFVRAMSIACRLPRDRKAALPAVQRAGLRSRLRPAHTRARDAAAIRFHYDLGNDFYRLWLDRRMVYSCAYFPTGAEDLDAAQTAKLDYICRKLRLAPGERLLDIGCGWGALSLYAAARYGVDAVGITLSPAQATEAMERIQTAGLAARCRVEVRDYRDLPSRAEFDKVASVGMVEHVGRRRFAEYFAAAYRVIRPGGLFLNHGIVSLDDARPRSLGQRLASRLVRRGAFIGRYIFPDGELLPLAEAVGRAETAGFETRDVESLREHYARTLRHWRARLEAQRDAAVREVGDATYRLWRLYLAASAHAFAVGRLGVVQMLLAKPDAGGRCSLPPTRSHLYAVSGSAPSVPLAEGRG